MYLLSGHSFDEYMPRIRNWLKKRLEKCCCLQNPENQADLTEIVTVDRTDPVPEPEIVTLGTVPVPEREAETGIVSAGTENVSNGTENVSTRTENVSIGTGNGHSATGNVSAGTEHVSAGTGNGHSATGNVSTGTGNSILQKFYTDGDYYILHM